MERITHGADIRSGTGGEPPVMTEAAPSASARMDRGTVIGMLASVGLLLAVVIAGAGYAAGVFWQTSSMALVVGGSVLATLASVPAGQFRSLGAVLRNAVYVRTAPTEASILTLVRLAEIARRDGILALERPVSSASDEFLQRATRMVIDGNDAATINSVLGAELEGTDLRHAAGKGVFDSIARMAPVFGMIGTVVGLIIMLGHMDDPTKIGPGMAVALLTTLYGLVLANVFCLPLARKLAHRSSEELLHKTIVLKGVLAIQAGDHPRLVEQKLRAYLPGRQRDPQYRPAPVDRTVAATRPSPPAPVVPPVPDLAPVERKAPRRELVEAA